ANEEQVAEIFVRVNSQGIKLRQSDFILTLMSVHWEEGRREIEKFCRSAVDPAVKGPSARNVFLDPEPAQLVRAGVGLAFRRGSLGSVYNILRGKDLATGDVSAQRRDEQFAKLTEAQEDVLNLTNWHEYLKCLTLAGFRSRRMIAAETAIVYTYILWLIGKRDYGLDYATLRGVISRWFFMAHTTNRYTGAAESQIEFDMRLLEGIEPGNGEAFCTKLDSIVKTHLTPDYWSTSLPNRLDTSAAKSPPLCAYWAALNLLDAELLFSKLRVHDLFGDPAPKTIERHHLFPKNHLAGEGITTRREVNAIANMAFLDWSENATISDADPADYWPRMTEKLDPATLEKQMYWHALPRGWETMPYQEFLTERRKLIAEVTRDGFRHLSDDRDADTTADTDPSTAELFAAGESQTVELKSTARWNLIAGIKDDKISHMVLKTVCGFLNVEGGTLVIGVDDDGKVVGLDHDYSTFSGKPNRDGFELWLWDYLEVNTSHPIAGVLHVEFSNPDGAGDVCIIRVAAARKPVFAKPQSGGGDPSEFWVRIGNATKQLYGDDMTTYQKDHWG
ncbi:MAG TPA: hypothetical protein DEP66_05185, partial [Acidimicrobiaceae bacterium]|nr:hypothetical protein [Acidimicrobiaceae bacterium]